jgi:hypothetical protein
VFWSINFVGVAIDGYPSDHILSAVSIERHPSNIMKLQYERPAVIQLEVYSSAGSIKFYSHEFGIAERRLYYFTGVVQFHELAWQRCGYNDAATITDRIV